MSTLVRTEVGRDQRGNKFQTNVYESFTTMTPDPAASSWTLTQSDGVFTLTETYTEQVPDPGGGGGGTTYPDIWSLEASTISDPIESNNYFKYGLSAQEMGWWTQWKSGAAFGPNTYPEGFPKNAENPKIGELLERFNRGETDYLSPRIIIKHQKVYSVAPTFSLVGKAFGTIDGCPFQFGTTINFLFTGASITQEGSNYRVTLEYLTSKSNFWDELIYGNIE